MNKIASGIIGIAVALSAVPFVAGAEEAATTGSTKSNVREVKTEVKEVKKETQEKRLDVKKEIEQKREELKDETEENRGEFKSEMEQKRLTASTTRQVFRAEVKERREVVKVELQDKREKFQDEAKKRIDGLKKKFGEERASRIENYFKQMLEKFEAAIERHTSYADKIADFLDRAEANGKDVTALREKLAVANTTLLEAERALEDAKAKYAEAAANTDFKARFAAVHTIVEGVAEKVRAAHATLVDVVNSIKGLNS
ncbi:MAG: hypothetical protein Q7R54_02165 [bacterium]|nr:hypothetical protein [bacterium]